jgi:hypothetical protein
MYFPTINLAHWIQKKFATLFAAKLQNVSIVFIGGPSTKRKIQNPEQPE